MRLTNDFFVVETVDQTEAKKKAVALLKQYRNIDIEFKPTQSQQNTITRFWAKHDQDQRNQALQSEMNNQLYAYKYL